MIKSNFLNILKNFNKQRGHKLSMNEFHKLTGISLPISSRLFHNKVHGFSFDTLDRLIKFFNVPPNDFVTFYDKPLRMVLYDADSHYVTRFIDRNGLDDMEPSYSGHNGIVLTFIGHKSPVHILLVLASPFYPLESGNGDFYFHFGYEVTDNNGFIDDFPLMNLSYNRRFKYLFNHNLTSRLLGYIYSRLLLHSGLISHDCDNKITVSGIPDEDEITVTNKFDLDFYDASFKNAAELIHMWRHQPNEKDTNGHKYKLVSSEVGQPIKIHDYTTNIFSK